MLAYLIELDGDVHGPMYEKFEEELGELNKKQQGACSTAGDVVRQISKYKAAFPSDAVVAAILILDASWVGAVIDLRSNPESDSLKVVQVRAFGEIGDPWSLIPMALKGDRPAVCAEEGQLPPCGSHLCNLTALSFRPVVVFRLRLPCEPVGDLLICLSGQFLDQSSYGVTLMPGDAFTLRLRFHT
jgi:hypothetical protein